jgi:hypothetical protein
LARQNRTERISSIEYKRLHCLPRAETMILSWASCSLFYLSEKYVCIFRLSRRTCLCFMQVCAGLLTLLVLPLRSADSKTVYLNTAPGVAYVGSQVCSGCPSNLLAICSDEQGSPMILANVPSQLSLRACLGHTLPLRLSSSIPLRSLPAPCLLEVGRQIFFIDHWLFFLDVRGPHSRILPWKSSDRPF